MKEARDPLPLLKCVDQALVTQSYHRIFERRRCQVDVCVGMSRGENAPGGAHNIHAMMAQIPLVFGYKLRRHAFETPCIPRVEILPRRS